jgi:hypothetical protein
MVIAPDGFADINSFEAVQAEFKTVRQLFGFEGQLEANTTIRKVVNRAMMHCLALKQNPSGVVSPRPLR